MCVSHFLVDNHYKRMPGVTVDVARYTTLTEQWSPVPNSPSPEMVTFPYELKVPSSGTTPPPQTQIKQNHIPSYKVKSSKND